MTDRKRILSMVLAALLVLQVLPLTVLAEGVAIISNVLRGQTYHTVTFLNGDTTVATQYVRSGGTLILPEAPTMDDHRFDGWFSGGAAVNESTAVTADMTVNARFHRILRYTFIVDYVDEAGNKVMVGVKYSYTEDDDLPVDASGVKYITVVSPTEVQKEDYNLYPDKASVTFYLTGAEEQTQTVTYAQANIGYTVEHYAMRKVEGGDGSVSFTRDGATLIPGTTQQLSGLAGSWLMPIPLTLANYTYMEADEIRLETDASLNVGKVYYAPVQYALNYDSQGGSYIAPKVVWYGDSVNLYTGRGRNASPAPTREGFTFTGWYLDAACTQEAPQTLTITGNTTIYAGWSAATAAYTVLYQKQVFDESGNLVYVYHTAETAYGTVGEMSNAPDGNVPKHYLVGDKTNVIIAADGSSVATVDYDLIVYTLQFNLTNERRSGTINGMSTYSFTARLGENVVGRWPTPDMVVANAPIGKQNPYEFDQWIAANRPGFKTARYEVTEEMLPDSGTVMTFTARWSEKMYARIVRYWLQSVDGTTYTVSESHSQELFQVENEGLNAKELHGFEVIGSDDNYYDPYGNEVEQPATMYNFTFNGKTYDTVWVYNFYYTRSKYQIDYYYQNTKLNTQSGIYFGQDISGTTYTPTAAAAGLAADYVFAGWYDNSECLGTPYTFTTMPANNVILYAKFNPPDRTLTLLSEVHLEGTYETVETITVPIGSKVSSLPVPTREGYTFLGWFSEPTGGVRYDLEMPLTDHVTYYAHWERVILGYVVHYVNESGVAIAQDRTVSGKEYSIGQSILEYPVTVPGYRPQLSQQTLILQGDNALNVLTFVYVLRERTYYTVQYLIEGTTTPVLPAATKEADKLIERVTIFAPTNIAYDGRVWYPTLEMQSLMLAADPDDNIITFYYRPYRTATVNVEFYYSDVLDTSMTRTMQVVIGDSVNAGPYKTDDAYTRNGTYVFEKAEPENITIDASMAGTTVTMKLYYDRASVAYQVNHYLYGTTTSIVPSSLGSGLVGDDVTIFAAAGTGEYASAVFSSFEAGSNFAPTGSSGVLTLSGNVQENVVNVYYKLPVTVTANTAAYVYDGAAKKALGADGLEYTVTGLLASDSLTGVDVKYLDGAESYDDRTDVGSYTAIIASMGILPAYYDVLMAEGLLTITPGTGPAIEAHGYVGIYDGQRHVVTVSGTVAGDTVYFRTADNAWTTDPIGRTDVDVYSPELLVYVKVVNPNYADRTAQATVQILPREIEVHAEATVPYNGQTQLLYVTANDVVAGKGPINGETLTLTGARISGTDVGIYEDVTDYTWHVRKADGLNVSTHNYAIKVTGKLTITARPVTFTGESDTHYYYAGRIHELTEITVSGLIAGHSYENLTYSAKGEELGTYPGAFTGEENLVIRDQQGRDVTANYQPAFIPGELIILANEGELHVVLHDKTEVYSGQAHFLNAATANRTDGTVFTYRIVGSETWVSSITDATLGRTDVGSVDIEVKAVHPEYGEAGAAYATATLTVVPRKVTVTSATDRKVYDGIPLTNHTVTESERGFVAGEGLVYTVTGSQLDVGRSANTFTYVAKDGTDLNNYEITKVEGWLTVTAITTPIIVAADSAEKVYDGTALTAGYTFTQGVLVKGDTLFVQVQGSQTNVGASRNVIAAIRVMRGTTDVTNNYTIGESKVGTLSVTPRPLTFTGESGVRAYTGTEHRLTGVSTSEPTATTGLVAGHTASGHTYAARGTNAGTYPGAFTGMLTVTDASGADVTVNYTVTRNPGTLTIVKGSEGYLEAQDYIGVYDGQAHSINVVDMEGDVLSFSLTGNGTDWSAAMPQRTDAQAAETIYVRATNPNYEDRYASATITITPQRLYVYRQDSKVYDGTPLVQNITAKDLVSVSRLVPGETLTLAATASATDVGIHEQTLSGYTWSVTKADGADSTGNYTITVESLIEITARTVTFTGETAARTYTGETQTITGITADGLADGHTFTLTYTASGLDVGEYPGTFGTDLAILDAQGNNVTASYTAAYIPGMLTIVKDPAHIIITAASAEKVYDGTELTDGGYTYTPGILKNGDVLSATVEGSQTDVGVADNVVTAYKVERNGVDVTHNYYFGVPVNGRLTVTPRRLVIRSATAQKLYDGIPLIKPEVTIVSGTFAPGEGMSYDFAASEITHVGIIANEFELIPHAGTKRENYEITREFGTLSVNPRTVHLTSATASKPWDGLPLTDETITVTGDGFIQGEGVTVNVTGSQTNVGSSDNTFTWVLNEGTQAADYNITTELGLLTVTGDALDTGKATPEVTSNYQLGETIPFTITVTNVTDKTLTDIVVIDRDAVLTAGTGYLVSGDGHTATIIRIPVGGSVVIQAGHIVTEADIRKGTVKNVATVAWEDERYYPTAETDQIDPPDTTLDITKTSDVPEGETVGAGDVITYTITVTNLGNVTFTNVAVVDELDGIEVQTGENYTVSGDTATIERLSVGETVTITATYTVTEADLLAGHVYNHVTATGDPVPGGDGEDPKIPEDEDDEDDPTDDLTVALIVEKTSDVPDGVTLQVGDLITYTITVTNGSNVTLTNVVVEDHREGVEILPGADYAADGAMAVIDTLAVGQTVTLTATGMANQEDLRAGEVYNYVYAHGDPIPNPKAPGDAFIPEDDGEVSDPIEELINTLDLEKTTLGIMTDDGSYTVKPFYEAGDEIFYLLTVFNTGNVDIHDLRLVDELVGYDETFELLPVGEQLEVIVSYTVTEADVDAGEVRNVATASGDPDAPEPPADTDETVDPADEVPNDPDGHNTDEEEPKGRPVMNVGDCFE